MGLKTRILTARDLDLALYLLNQGQVVAFPTETVYGLGANALDPQAVGRIFKAKGRPADNPLIVHCRDQAQVSALVTAISNEARVLMEQFWPGPLTLVLPKTAAVPAVVSAGLETVGIRIPDHPLALELLAKAGFPLAAPSANISGRPSPTRVEHVLADLGGRIPAIIDGGETGWGLESTVLDCTIKPFRVLRPGGITKEELEKVVPLAESEDWEQDQKGAPPSPGMKHEHYAPQARVYLIQGAQAASKILELAEKQKKAGKKAGIMVLEERSHLYPGYTVLSMGSGRNLKTVAANLYHLFRTADQLGLQVLLVEGMEEKDLGQAIMNRLKQASAGRVIQA
ncbi:MAG: threonylcarbamoyl-AMP synthase [Firmicutes bacterium]|nr:threonylcarbamoyl-AMP synthase [Bacillota bacterium]